MPLIEPQEWKEVKKVEDFAIVIHTSMSCSGDLVKKFLEETYGVLTKKQRAFFIGIIHMIFSVMMVQNYQKITDEKELKEYMEHLELIGEGGTDFRPAFEYVNYLIEQVNLLSEGIEYSFHRLERKPIQRRNHHIRQHLFLCRKNTKMWMYRHGS